MTLPADFLARCAAEVEVRIVTTRPDGSPRRTIVWVVVEGKVAYLRSFRGADGQWYRDVLVRPHATLVVAGHEQAVRLVRADDPASVAACSAGLERKYAGDASLSAMLVDDVLPTTLRLEAR